MRWIIGDIHGMYRMLCALLDAVRQKDSQPQFYFVGDYVNRGPESKQVVDLLLSLENAKFARGNHDEVFDLVLNNHSFAPHPEMNVRLEAFLGFLQFGLDATLLSYGIQSEKIAQAANRPSFKSLDHLIECIPSSHRRFFQSLPAVIEEPDFLIAHGKWDTDANNDADQINKLAPDSPQRNSIIWGRYAENEIRKSKPWLRRMFFGHTPVSTYASFWTRDAHRPIIGPKIVLLDTGAALSMQGRLTAVCAEDLSFIQIDRGGNVLPGQLQK